MPSLRITKFCGIVPAVAPRLLKPEYAQVAHNALLTDGSLRPYAKWLLVDTGPDTRNSIALNTRTNQIEYSIYTDAIKVNGPPFGPSSFVGVTNPSGLRVTNQYTNEEYAVALSGVGTFSASAVGAGLSTKPMNRMYGYTVARFNGVGYEEGPMRLCVGVTPTQIMYEGDTVSISDLGSTIPANEYIRFYRTVSRLESGEKIANKFETEWHLLGQIPSTTPGNPKFIDGDAPTSDPLDLYLAGHFYPPLPTIELFDMTEGGWFVGATIAGDIQMSERYLHHAWPIENRLNLGMPITSIAVYQDNVYAGTASTPFVISLAPGEQAGLQARAEPFPEPYPCLQGTMVATSSGAAYTAAQGVIGLSPQGQKVLTAGLANSGNSLHEEYVLNEIGNEYLLKYQFKDTVFALAYQGSYYGFLGSGYTEVEGEGLYYAAVSKTLFILDLKDNVNGVNEFQQLVTMDFPASAIRSWCTGPQGLYALALEETTDVYETKTYVLPLPDNRTYIPYDKAPKNCYIWKSKVFTFPGQTTMAAAKVVMKGKRPVTFKLYVDGCCIFETVVCGSKPFALPANIIGIDFEVEVKGKAHITEIHVASSVRELLENG